jgi:Uma2 family endonuclease
MPVVTVNHPLLDELERSPKDGHRRDLVRGRLIDMPPAWRESSRVAFEIAFHLRLFIGEHHLPMSVAGADAGIRIAEPRGPGLPPEIVSPDAQVVADSKLPPDMPPGFWPLVPDIAVEVLSPSDRWRDVQDKIDAYMDAGTPLLWIVDPRRQMATVYRPGQPPLTLRKLDDILDGGDVLPGFGVTLREVFERPAP